MRTTKYEADGEWLGFWDDKKMVAGFVTPEPEKYDALVEAWALGDWSWNKLVSAINDICGLV